MNAAAGLERDVIYLTLTIKFSYTIHNITLNSKLRLNMDMRHH